MGFDLSGSKVLRKDLSVNKVGEIAQVDPNLAGQLFNAIIKQIGQFIKTGRSVAVDLKLPQDVFLLISPNGYEFANKNGIAEKVNDLISGPSIKTDTSSR